MLPPGGSPAYFRSICTYHVYVFPARYTAVRRVSWIGCCTIKILIHRSCATYIISADQDLDDLSVRRGRTVGGSEAPQGERHGGLLLVACGVLKNTGLPAAFFLLSPMIPRHYRIPGA